MIELIIAIGWLLGTITTYRSLAYSLNASVLRGHEYQSVCDSCRCTDCGESAHRHSGRSSTPCRGAEWRGMHAMPLIFGFMLSVTVWPVIMLVWAGGQAKRLAGIETTEFFRPAPSIKTKAERQEARFAERERAIAAAEAEAEAQLKRINELRSA